MQRLLLRKQRAMWSHNTCHSILLNVLQYFHKSQCNSHCLQNYLVLHYWVFYTSSYSHMPNNRPDAINDPIIT